MRKYLIGGLVGAALMFPIQSFAETAKQYVLSKIGYPVFVNGKEYAGSDLPFLNYEGNTYAPLKAIGDLLGAPVNWNDKLTRVEIGNTPMVNELSEVNNVATIKIGNTKYATYGEGVAVQNGRYFISLNMVNTLLSYGYKEDYTIQPSSNPYIDGGIQFKRPYPYLKYEEKYTNAKSSYSEITFTSPDKNKSYFISLKPNDIKGAVEKMGVLTFKPMNSYEHLALNVQ
ncbi:hypothetical protein FE783_36030 [Paenibacillus mesophilus]|uniref:stalk domain-containing protein n=1 Tax=Paenibacillus mesophilus TaxID=2582849 RepID=UPI00110F6218|nr:stalk domain-containing protein [Paenibacillus mesophilus]TMV43139.1 hypothetical protein FE783_36030 [Paenibacillus mesophilus]